MSVACDAKIVLEHFQKNLVSGRLQKMHSKYSANILRLRGWLIFVVHDGLASANQRTDPRLKVHPFQVN